MAHTMQKKWIWQASEWPKFHFESAPVINAQKGFVLRCATLRHEIDVLPERDRIEVILNPLVDEVIGTSAIEGESLRRDDVRSSLEVQLGLVPEVPQDKQAKGMVSALLACREAYFDPLDHHHLLAWQKDIVAAMDVAPGWRTAADGPMQVVSGRISDPTVHFEAVPAGNLKRELDVFLKWFNDTDPMVNPVPGYTGAARAAVAHLWFETLHPFRDGNGRVGRLIAEKALAQELRGQPLFSLSAMIESERKAYYEHLGRQQRGDDMDVTSFMVWFSDVTQAAQQKTEIGCRFVIEKARFWDAHRSAGLSDRQRDVINKIFDKGPDAFPVGIQASHYKGLGHVSKATATRDLGELVEKGVLVKLDSGGRSTRYCLNSPWLLNRVA